MSRVSQARNLGKYFLLIDNMLVVLGFFVVVIMDFMAQVQTLMMSSQYESALKKANLKGYGR